MTLLFKHEWHQQSFSVLKVVKLWACVVMTLSLTAGVAEALCMFDICLSFLSPDERNPLDHSREEQTRLGGKLTHEWPASLSLQLWTSRPCWGSTRTPTPATGRGWDARSSLNKIKAPKVHPAMVEFTSLERSGGSQVLTSCSSLVMSR